MSVGIPDIPSRLRALLDADQAVEAFLQIRSLLTQSTDLAPHILGFYGEAVWRGIAHSVSNCDWTHYDLLVRALPSAMALDPDFWMVGETTLTLAGVSRQQLLELNRRYCRRFSAHGAAFEHAPPSGPIRIGILGRDFYSQATAYLFTGVAEHMDRSRFHLTAYDFADNAPDSEWRRRCLDAYDRFASIAGLDDHQAAARIHADGIDVLVHMRDVPNGRLGICALRPAPVQIQYLYFPGTSGAGFMDWLIADEVVVPPGHEDGFAEPILRLPGCYQPNDDRRKEPSSLDRQHCGLPSNAIVIANFSENHKFTPDMFSLWCDLLIADGRRILWLLDQTPGIVANLKREAVLRGVAPDRLVFSPRMTTADHLARLRCADLVVDTFPYGGHTLTSDALWAGAALVTLQGETFASRVPASLLAQCGVPELATTSAGDYFALADRLLRDPAMLVEKRRTIAQARARSSLFSAGDYAEKFGCAIEDAVQRRWGDGSSSRARWAGSKRSFAEAGR